jgi:hypothetical protein
MTSIKTKILLIVGCSMVLGTLVVSFLFHQNYQRTLDMTAEESIRSSIESFQNLRKDNVDMMAAAVQALAGNQNISTTFAARDREGLLAATQGLYKSYNQRYGITHWNYWEPEPEGQTNVKGLVNFMRTATPSKYGEFLERVTLAEAVRTKTFVEGLDLGNTGFALRVIHPVYAENRLCGYFELGKDISSFLESMKTQTGDEYGLMLSKQKLDAKKWESSRTSRGLANNWDAMPDMVLAKNTTTDETIFAHNGSLDVIPPNGECLGLVKRNGHIYTRGAFPLTDATGATVGGIFVLRDITDIYARSRAAQTRAIVAIIVLMSLVGGAMVFLFDRMIIRRLNGLIDTATRVVGGDYETQVIPGSKDEIGQFEGLFEQFRTVFVGLVHDAEERNRKAA